MDRDRDRDKEQGQSRIPRSLLGDPGESPAGGVSTAANSAAGYGTLARMPLVERLYQKRSEHARAIDRIEATIHTLEANAQTARVVEAVLAGQQKVDSPVF